MKTRISLIAVAVVALVALFGSARGGEKKADDKSLSHPYFPLKVGTTWEYLAGGQKVVVKVAAHEMIDGANCARLETETAGGKVTEHLTVKDGKVYRVCAENQDIKPPVLLFWQTNAKGEGESWAVESTVQNLPLKGTLTIAEDKVTIGKTTYDTLRVKSSGDMIMAGRKMTMETWYAKDKGMVKQHIRLPENDLSIVLELESFTPAQS